MLVLSRRSGELIFITLPDGRVITLEVLDVCRERTRLGIAAPPDVPILRSELRECSDLTQPQGETK